MKRGQSAGGAAAFIALIAGFILLYILLLPPAERERLLDDGYGDDGRRLDDNRNTGVYIPKNTTVLSVNPGRVSYLKSGENEHYLPSVNLQTSVGSKEKMLGNAIYVKNGVFDKKERELEFELPDIRLVRNVKLIFSLNPNRNNKGRLTITLNGKNIFEKSLESGTLDAPIYLASGDLDDSNKLKFSVSGVGWRFWTTNEYELDDIKIIYDKINTENQRAKNTFMVSDTEKLNLESGVLKFTPDCSQTTVGILTAKLNNQIVYSAVPDCGLMNRIEISPSTIEAGMNSLVFEGEMGRYLISNIIVETKLEKQTFPVYMFDLDERLFSDVPDDSDDEACGDEDGVCPVGCPEYLDKDCCLKKTSKYWCDVMTDNINDRCRSVIYMSDCGSCPSGYEDYKGSPPEVCEDMCGDDTDNDCPAGCNKFYDKDCCFEEAETNYWCDEVPKYGLSHVCRAGIHVEDCDLCPSGYETEEGTFRCPDSITDPDEKSILKGNYDVWLRMRFFDDGERKSAKVFVNGYQFYMDTSKDEYERKIDDYVEDGSNAIKIEPDRTSLDITSLEIEVKPVR